MFRYLTYISCILSLAETTYWYESRFVRNPEDRFCQPGHVAQSVMCLATDACLTADPGVASSIPVRSHTLVEIDHEMIIPPANFVCGGYSVFTLSARNVLFP